jgi:hypothetical protein
MCGTVMSVSRSVGSLFDVVPRKLCLACAPLLLRWGKLGGLMIGLKTGQ